VIRGGFEPGARELKSSALNRSAMLPPTMMMMILHIYATFAGLTQDFFCKVAKLFLSLASLATKKARYNEAATVLGKRVCYNEGLLQTKPVMTNLWENGDDGMLHHSAVG